MALPSMLTREQVAVFLDLDPEELDMVIASCRGSFNRHGLMKKDTAKSLLVELAVRRLDADPARYAARLELLAPRAFDIVARAHGFADPALRARLATRLAARLADQRCTPTLVAVEAALMPALAESVADVQAERFLVLEVDPRLVREVAAVCVCLAFGGRVLPVIHDEESARGLVATSLDSAGFAGVPTELSLGLAEFAPRALRIVAIAHGGTSAALRRYLAEDLGRELGNARCPMALYEAESAIGPPLLGVLAAAGRDAYVLSRRLALARDVAAVALRLALLGQVTPTVAGAEDAQAFVAASLDVAYGRASMSS